MVQFGSNAMGNIKKGLGGFGRPSQKTLATKPVEISVPQETIQLDVMGDDVPPKDISESTSLITTVPYNDDLFLEKIEHIPLTDIDYRKYDVNERSRSFQRLAWSIKKNGVIHPIILRKKGNRYEIVIGNRRAAAAFEANKKDIVARILKEDLPEAEIRKICLIENLVREDAEPIELAKGVYALLKSLHPQLELNDMINLFINSDARPEASLESAGTVTAVKEITGRSASTIRNWLSIFKLDPAQVHQIEDKKLSISQAFVLAKHAKHGGFESALERAINEKLSQDGLRDLFESADSSASMLVRRTMKALNNLEQKIRAKTGQISPEGNRALLKKLHDLCAVLEGSKKAD